MAAKFGPSFISNLPRSFILSKQPILSCQGFLPLNNFKKGRRSGHIFMFAERAQDFELRMLAEIADGEVGSIESASAMHTCSGVSRGRRQV